MQGGPGAASAFINTQGALISVTIGGSLIGGTGGNSARIASDGDMGALKIGRDVQGLAIFTGLIQCGGKLAGVTIGGSLRGGTGRSSGMIFSQGDMGAVRIGEDFVGESIAGSAPTLDRSGFIESAAGRIVSVTIGGSVRAGADNRHQVARAHLFIDKAPDRVADGWNVLARQSEIVHHKRQSSAHFGGP